MTISGSNHQVLGNVVEFFTRDGIATGGGTNLYAGLQLAEQLVVAAAHAGADYAKLQKRVPRLAVPEHQWAVPKETPWGTMTYLEYKERMELDFTACQHLQRVAKREGIGLFWSVWDSTSLEWVTKKFGPPMLKIPSAKLTDHELVRAAGRWCGRTCGRCSSSSSRPATRDRTSVTTAESRDRP